MYLPRRAVGHVLEAPIAHPQNATHVLAVDRTCEEVHRTSMSDSVLAIPIREWVRGEVPVAEGRDEWSCQPESAPPGHEAGKKQGTEVPHSPGFDLPRPKVDLVKVAPGRGHR